jgi:hypothetical protein
MNAKFGRYLFLSTLLVILASIPVLGAGCEKASVQAPVPSTSFGLSSSLVPNLGLDVYVYVKQGNPTIVPKDLINVPADVAVESLSLWGIADADTMVFGGGLLFTSVDDAARIYSLIPGQTEFWSKLSDRMIYFVQGSGTAAETLKNAIANNDFKQYDDQQALEEVARLPDGGTTRLAAIGIVKPSQPLIKLIAKGINPESSGMINTLLKSAMLQVIIAGLYASQQIDITDIAQAIKNGDIWEKDLGILASVKSGVPGFVASPIIKRFLDNEGFTETSSGELVLYQGPLNTGNGRAIPVLIRIDGNRVFAAASGNDAYAQTLITDVRM